MSCYATKSLRFVLDMTQKYIDCSSFLENVRRHAPRLASGPKSPFAVDSSLPLWVWTVHTYWWYWRNSDNLLCLEHIANGLQATVISCEMDLRKRTRLFVCLMLWSTELQIRLMFCRISFCIEGAATATEIPTTISKIRLDIVSGLPPRTASKVSAVILRQVFEKILAEMPKHPRVFPRFLEKISSGIPLRIYPRIRLGILLFIFFF